MVPRRRHSAPKSETRSRLDKLAALQGRMTDTRPSTARRVLQGWMRLMPIETTEKAPTSLEKGEVLLVSAT